MNSIEQAIVSRLLRRYFNRISRICEEIDLGEVGEKQGNDEMLQLDAVYAKLIARELESKQSNRELVQ